MSVAKLDLQLIEEKTGIDDRELIVTVAEALAEEGPVRLTEIEQGLAQQDSQKVSIAAHTLKGASKAMVMMELAASAERIELAARDEDLAAVTEELPHLVEQVNAMLQAVEQFVAEGQ